MVENPLLSIDWDNVKFVTLDERELQIGCGDGEATLVFRFDSPEELDHVLREWIDISVYVTRRSKSA